MLTKFTMSFAPTTTYLCTLKAHLQWYRASSTWNLTGWNRLAFSDESHFDLSLGNQQVHAWRHSGQQWENPLTIDHRIVRYPGVFAWALFHLIARPPLNVIHDTLTEHQRYSMPRCVAISYTTSRVYI